MFQKFTQACVKVVQQYLPDPYLFAVILTLIVFVAAMGITAQTPMAMVRHWGNGFWGLLAFSMQMVLILVTGHTMASTPIIKNILVKLASLCKTPLQAIVAVTFVSTVACWINWGFGLVVGALYARQLAKKVPGVDYRLLIASAYAGFLVWHAGISGSIPLQLATPGAALATITAGAVTSPINTNLTIFAPYNLIIVGILLFTMPLIARAMHPAKDKVVTVDLKLLAEEEVVIKDAKNTFADRLESSTALSLIIGGMGLAFVIHHFYTNGFLLHLNIVNFMFLFAGILLHGTPRRFLNAVQAAVAGTAGIIVQFPFYAGIMGMMVGVSAATGTSLAGVISQWFIAISNQYTYPLFTFLSAGLINMFIPSGGGQWAVQAPIMMPASVELGVDSARTAMAIAWGDAWTNMIQPFWALPALGIAKLGARDIMGYLVTILLYSGLVIGIGLTFF